MVFSSLIFLFAYLPVTLLCYYALPRRCRNVALFLLSFLFYGWGEPVYVLLMVVSITTAFLFGFPISCYRQTNPQKARLYTAASVAVNLSFLFFFKYYHFFAENLSRLPFITIPDIKGLTLPIGISFYTFQIISYTVDLYRGDCNLQKNYISFGTYVTLFPQLIAGPIVRYHDIDGQLTERRETTDLFSKGITRFCAGLAKKVLIGDALAAGYEYYRSIAELSPTTLGAWMTVILFTLHLYYDFSGYSDMAIGLGLMFGFQFPENFNYPYIAKSITEFWRRWHISLSSWFREYVYIPLGGNRRGQARQYFNLFVVWLLTGFWHGASWNFVLWGLYFCVILICEKAFLLRCLKALPSVFQHIYTMLLVVFGFLIFSHSDLQAGWICLKAMLGIGVEHVAMSAALYQLKTLLPLILIAIIGATPLPRLAWNALQKRTSKAAVLYPIASALVLLLCTAYLVDSTFSPFAYTQF